MRFYLWGLLFILLASCGGGKANDPALANISTNGSSRPTQATFSTLSQSSAQASSPKSQTLLFYEKDPLNVLVGQSPKLLSFDGVSTSAVKNFISSNPTIANVDANGLLTILKEGTTVVSLHIDKGDGIAEQTASLTVNVAPREYEMTTLVGENDTKVLFQPAFNGLEFYRSTQRVCDLEKILGCADGGFDILNGSIIVDKAFTLTEPAYYTLKHGAASNFYEGEDKTFFSSKKLPHRTYHKVIYFNDHFFMIGGDEKEWQGGERDKSIWSSFDGISWKNVLENPPFGYRSMHQLLEFNKKLWLIGGMSNRAGGGEAQASNDIWSSIDGINWILEREHGEFPPVTLHEVVIFDSKMWLFNSGVDTDTAGDIWSSKDGVNWSKEDGGNIAVKGLGENFSVMAFNNKIWIVGGIGGNSVNVLSSSDGRNWLKEATIGSDLLDWQAGNFLHFVFNGRMYIYNTYVSASSVDGVNWIAEHNPSISSHSITSGLYVDLKDFNDRNYAAGISSRIGLLVIGGTAPEHIYKFDDPHAVLEPKEGQNIDPGHDRDKGIISFNALVDERQKWIDYSGNMPGKLSVKENISISYFKNKLWLIGKNVNSFKKNQNNYLSSSTNGVTWTLENKFDDGIAFSPSRYGARIKNFDGKLWLIGGSERSCLADEDSVDPELHTHLNDIWNSLDGINWAKVTDAAAFPPRMNHQLAVFKDELWVFGGEDCATPAGQQMADAWSSQDGITWRKRLDVAQLPTSPGTVKQAGSDIKMYSFINGVNREQLFWFGTFYERDPISQAVAVKTEAWTYDGSYFVRNSFGFSADVKDPSFERKIVVNGDKLLMLNGAGNEILESQDGLHWLKVGSSPFVKKGTDLVVLNGSYFIVGGSDRDGPSSDVWVSQDGREWRLATSYKITLH